MGYCSDCHEAEPLFTDGRCEDCHYAREQEDLDDTRIGYRDDDDWGEEP